MRLLAEDLLLLLLDRESGRLSRADDADHALAGGLLVELALVGCAELRKEGPLRRSRVVATGVPAPPGPLAEALAVVAERERTAPDLVRRLRRGLRERLLQDLAAEGRLTRETDLVLGIVQRTRWPASPGAVPDGTARELRRVLVEGTDPDDRAAALIALLSAIGRAQEVVRGEGLPAREVRRRAKDIAEGSWAADAVRQVIRATHSAVAAAASDGGGGDGGGGT